MKKIITAILAAVLLFSVSACSDSSGITADDINGIIDSVKEEYAKAEEITLSDGTVVSAKHKNPDITVEDVKDGSATDEQKNDFVVYMANIRKIVFDRLSSAYGEKNYTTVDTDDGGKEHFIFLDPEADGYANATEALSDMRMKRGQTVTDYVYLNESMVILFEKGEKTSQYLCPTKEENDLITEIMK